MILLDIPFYKKIKKNEYKKNFILIKILLLDINFNIYI